jgi:putative ABC transport system permease protein
MLTVRAWLRWSWRDLRQRWLLVTTIALVIALGTGTYAALTSTSAWRRLSNDASFAAVSMHDLRVTLTSGTTADQGRLLDLVRSIPSRPEIGRARERLLVPTQLSVTSADEEVVVPATVVGHSGLGGATVDAVDVTRGSLPSGGERWAVLERKFAAYYALPPRGRVELPGGRSLPYAAFGAGPEEFVVTGRGGVSFLGEAGFATAYVPLPVAQSLSPALRGQVNDLVLLLEPGADRAKVAAELSRAARVADEPLAVEVSTREEDPAYRILYEDIDGDHKFWTVVALLILAGATFAAVNLTTRVVEAQRREIGIGMAMGLRPRALAIRPLLLGAQVAVGGVVLGLLVAYAMRPPLVDLYTGVLPLPEWRTPFQVWPFVRAALVGALLPLLAVAVPVWRAVSVQPVEAIRVGHLAAKGSRLLTASRWVRLPGREYRSMPLRNLVRTPRRTALTILAVAAAISTLVAIGGLLDSFRASVRAGEQELARGSPDRLMVTLDAWYPPSAPQVQQVLTLPEVGRAATGLQVPMTAGRGEHAVDLVTEAVPEDSPWRPSLLDGSRAGGLVLAEKAAKDLRVTVGDRVPVSYPRPVAGGGASTVAGSLRVAGIHPNPLRVLAYVDAATARSLGLTGVVNRLQLLPADSVRPGQLRTALFGQPAVATVEDVVSTSRMFDDALEQFVGVLVIMGGAVLLLALLIAYNSSSISVDERARDHATMLAFGLPLRQVLGMLTVESLAIGVLGSLLGLASGYGLVSWMVRSILSDTLPDFGVPAQLGTTTVAVAFAVGVAGVAAAPGLTFPRLRRLDLPGTLRILE